MFINPFFHEPDFGHQNLVFNAGMVIQIGFEPEELNEYVMAQVWIFGKGQIFDN
jgi:hypothetical protein